MRIVAWNVGHQTRERRFKAVFAPVVEGLAPDVLVLNEYVDGASRAQMKDMLSQLGVEYVLCSTRFERNNQVLIASRYPIATTKNGCALADPMAMSNLLHVKLESGMEVVGMRTPAYKYARERAGFWDDFVNVVRGMAGRRIAFIGDLNADPRYPRQTGAKALAALQQEGWQIPDPEGPWSYCSSRAQTRLDHAILPPDLLVERAVYWPEVRGLRCAGPDSALYDHAPLSLDIRH